MQLQKLSLTNFRAFKQADFEFKPGMNLIVGINGVGKSSVLDAIRIMFSRVVPQISHLRSFPLSFTNDDITVNESALSVSMNFLYGQIAIDGLAQVFRENTVDTNTEGDVRNQTYDLDNRYQFSPDTKIINIKLSNKFGQPLVVYYSTSRSVTASHKMKSRSDDPNLNALLSRELQIREFASWWLVQNALMKETTRPVFGKNMSVLGNTVSRFLDTVSSLKAMDNPKPTLFVEKNGKQLDVGQMSDGERGVLALVFDLARRLAAANPKLPNPLDGEAIVLIDELDLHLHPRWQRDVVKKLTDTFPNCQFIATTHSPQIVGEVPPEKIIILQEGKPPYRPDQSLGMDTNWILEFLMGTKTRNDLIQKKLDLVSDLIEEQKYKKAQSEIDYLRENGLDRDPEILKLQTRLDRFVILGTKKKKK